MENLILQTEAEHTAAEIHLQTGLGFPEGPTGAILSLLLVFIVGRLCGREAELRHLGPLTARPRMGLWMGEFVLQYFSPLRPWRTLREDFSGFLSGYAGEFQ